MGLHRQVPDRLRQLHPRYGTPWVGIIVFGAVACVAMIPGQAAFLGNMYAFGAMLSFTIAHLSVIRLRQRFPDADRPYSGPGNLRIGRFELPLFAVVGGIGTGLAFVVVTALHLDVALAGVGWLAFGCVIYLIYRRHQGLDLTTTTKVAVPKPVIDHEAEYQSVLVAVADGEYSRSAMATAIKVAARRKRGIHVIVPITVPASSPIGAEMPDQELAAQAIIEQAKLQGGRRVSGHWAKVRAGQAGRLIIKEAKEMRAQAIVVPLPPRSGGSVFGKTVETILAERPCRVVLLADPSARDGGAPRRPSAARPPRARPGEHRARATRPPRQGHHRAVGGDGGARRRDPRLDAGPRWRAAGRRHPARRAVHRRRRRAPLRAAGRGSGGVVNERRERRLERRDRAFRRGLGVAGDLRDLLHVGRQRPVLLAGRHRRARARDDAVRVPGRRIAFALATMTYVEGASLHQDRAGSTVFARFAFNELISFVAGWAILLDYTILIAITALSATHYLAAFWSPIENDETLELAVALGIIGYVAIRNVRGFSRTRVNRVAALVVADLALQILIIVLGLFAFFDLDLLLNSINLGTYPTWDELIFALGVATVIFTGLESAAGLSGEVAVGRRGLQRLVFSATAAVMIVYVGIALVAMTALPAVANETSLARNFLEAPMLGIAASFDQDWLADGLTYVIAAAASVHADRGVQLGDAGPVAAGVLLGHEPPDPRRHRAPAPDALDAVHPHQRRGGAWRRRS
jgi:amino acid transporter